MKKGAFLLAAMAIVLSNSLKAQLLDIERIPLPMIWESPIYDTACTIQFTYDGKAFLAFTGQTDADIVQSDENEEEYTDGSMTYCNSLFLYDKAADTTWMIETSYPYGGFINNPAFDPNTSWLYYLVITDQEWQELDRYNLDSEENITLDYLDLNVEFELMPNGDLAFYHVTESVYVDSEWVGDVLCDLRLANNGRLISKGKYYRSEDYDPGIDKRNYKLTSTFKMLKDKKMRQEWSEEDQITLFYNRKNELVGYTENKVLFNFIFPVEETEPIIEETESTEE